MKRKRNKSLLYFFYQGDLHKRLFINRGQDLITAWNYPKHQSFIYQYSEVRRNGEKAFTTAEVAKFLNRTRRPIERAINVGAIPIPQMTYSLETGNPFQWMWNEKDIMRLHDFLKTVHIGRPRNDGQINTGDLPSAAELRASIRQGRILYVKEGDDFVPTWQAEKF